MNKGAAKSAEELEETYKRAGFLVARSYLILSKDYHVNHSPSQASLQMSAALQALDNGFRHGDDRLQAEAPTTY